MQKHVPTAASVERDQRARTHVGIAPRARRQPVRHSDCLTFFENPRSIGIAAPRDTWQQQQARRMRVFLWENELMSDDDSPFQSLNLAQVQNDLLKLYQRIACQKGRVEIVSP